MGDYNYFDAVNADVLEYIKNEIDLKEFETLEDLDSFLNEDLWTADSVTGNGSGSYTFSTWQAEEYLCHNLDLLNEACQEFGFTEGMLANAEAADVTIRCYLLNGAIAAALDEIEDDFIKAHEGESDNEEN